VEASQWIAGGGICGSLHLAAQEGVQSRPPEARALDRIRKSIRHTHNPAGDEHAMRTEPSEEVHARIGRSKILFTKSLTGLFLQWIPSQTISAQMAE